MRCARHALPALVLLAGCGSGPPPDEVAREYVAGEGPSKCEAASQAFLERQTGRSGAAARAACRDAAERLRPPAEVRVTGSQVRGDRATVALRADGQAVGLELERRGDRWLVTGFER